MFLRIGRHEGDQDSLTGLFAPVGQAFQPVKVESRRALNHPGRFTNRSYDAALHSGQTRSITRAGSAFFFTLVLVGAVREPPVLSGPRSTARLRVFWIRQRTQSEKRLNPARDWFFSILLAAGVAILAITAAGCTSNQSAHNAQAAAARAEASADRADKAAEGAVRAARGATEAADRAERSVRAASIEIDRVSKHVDLIIKQYDERKRARRHKRHRRRHKPATASGAAAYPH